MKKYLFIVLALFMVSCHHSGVMQDVSVELASPEKVVSQSIDTTFGNNFSEILNCFRLQIVNDTILVVQEQTNNANVYNFKAYSVNDFNYMGAFARNGRGPGEMIHPHVAICSNARYLNINLNSEGKAYSVNVEETLQHGKLSIVQDYTLPVGTIDWLPLPDLRQFVLQSEKGCITFRYVGMNNEVSNTFELNKSIDKENFVTYLSSVMASNLNNGKVVDAMIFFPQINIFDTENGTLKSVAVNKSYRKWESVINRMIGSDTRQYYVGVSSSQDYIFAAYKDVTLEELMKGIHETSIHVFDWDGNFLYDINVEEDIEDMTFDSRTGYLYCIEKSERKIVRYDLSELL
mgnify:CR=1 FL=1